MSTLREVKVLALVDDETAKAAIESTLQPIVKTLIVTNNVREATWRAEQGAFNLFVLRTKTPQLTDPKSFFFWCKLNKDLRSKPWVIYGTDIEPAEICAKIPNLARVENGAGTELIKAVETLIIPTAKRAA